MDKLLPVKKVLWHTLPSSAVLDQLHTQATGLSTEEFQRRLQKFGSNKLPEAKVDSWWIIVLHQFQSPLIYILLLASSVVFLMGEVLDGCIIMAVLLINAVVGTIQEGRAQNTLLALKRLAVARVVVLRDNREIYVNESELVLGDVVVLREGDKVPADLRLLSANNMKVEQAALTGESKSIVKHSQALTDPKLGLADQTNMVWQSSHITTGRGAGVVVATSLDTVIGKISKQIAAIDTQIPLARSIHQLSKLILLVVIIISLMVFVLGWQFGISPMEMFKVAIALAVSAVPEGLPIVITLVLATGVWRMSKRNVLVKRLQAVEALGRAQVIAVDKTGTITKNEMVIRQINVNGKEFEISGAGYESTGQVKFMGKVIQPLLHSDFHHMARVAAFCADARPVYDKEYSTLRVSGDPTEAAMFVLAAKVGLDKDVLEQTSPQIFDIPFTPQLKYHATVHRVSGRSWLKVVGAPEMVLALCKYIRQSDGTLQKMTPESLRQAEAEYARMSAQGLRILAVGEAWDVPDQITTRQMPALALVGFFGMYDGLRSGVKQVIKKAQAGGIKFVMMTGDYQITAQAIAKEAGIYQTGDKVITGQEIEEMTEKDLDNCIERVSVFARVTSEHKLRIVQAYRRQGKILAMTGDGVNDAPSLVAADLGIGMGLIGTEVAKEASDIILLDDNLASIVAAIEEGRHIHITIKKVILYLFSTSLGEIMVITLAIVLGYPLPILAAQILWLNLVTDGLLDVALAMEPKDDTLMSPAYTRRYLDNPRNQSLVDGIMWQRMVLMAGVMALGSFLVFRYYWLGDNADSMPHLWTIVLTILAAFQWFNAWNCRSSSRSLLQINLFSNKFLLLATITAVLLQLLAIYTPGMQALLRTAALSWSDWAIILTVAPLIIVVEEIRKLVYRQRKKQSDLSP